jgi:O-antigen/teichoic acid export membrane protein
VLSVLYFRVAQVMVSLLSTGEETGFFGVSFRVLETLTTIPALLVSSALPILARAARDDSDRFVYVGRRLAETMVIAGVGLALVLFLSAEFCIDLVAGPGFERSIDVLRILAFALIGTFVIAARGYALLSLDRMRAILVSNAIALVIVVTAGVPLTKAYGAVGTAITLLAAELTLAACYELALTHQRSGLRPAVGFVGRVIFAAVVAGLPALLLGLPSMASGAVGAVTYLAALLVLGAVPVELRQALSPKRPTAAGEAR